jgi:hypothetical protein
VVVKMLLGFTTRPAKWFAVLAVPFLAGTLLALAAAVYVEVNLPPGGKYSLVFPAITILLAFASAHLTILGLLSELVVRVGDFKASDVVLPSFDRGGRS